MVHKWSALTSYCCGPFFLHDRPSSAHLQSRQAGPLIPSAYDKPPVKPIRRKRPPLGTPQQLVQHGSLMVEHLCI